jgi:hypothetical protein
MLERFNRIWHHDSHTQIDEYGYPYLHRKFASYGAVNGSYFFVISGIEMRCRIRIAQSKLRLVTDMEIRSKCRIISIPNFEVVVRIVKSF